VKGFIHLTDKDGDPVALKADTITGVYQTSAKSGGFFAHDQQEPARTVVVATAGGFTVTQTHQEVLDLITESTGAAA
jgi:hypothetical protein